MGGYAIAQQTNGSDFTNADANRDNTASFEKAGGVYPTLTQQLFDNADVNKDGILDGAEYTSLGGLSAVRRPPEYDLVELKRAVTSDADVLGKPPARWFLTFSYKMLLNGAPNAD